MSSPPHISVPLFVPDFGEEEQRLMLRCLEDAWVAQGPRCLDLEQAFSDRLTIEHACALSSCTAALHLAMMLVGVQPGDEVIVPSLTFAATANAVAYCGATPVFADITSTGDWTIDPDDVAAKVSAKTRAIVPMHYGGFPADMQALAVIARTHDLRVVEDACHGLGGTLDGKAMGTIGDIGCFSFYSNKVMTTGEGGLLVTHDEAYDKRCRLLRSHGMTAGAYDRMLGALDYDIAELGYNYRMDDIRAALGLAQLERLDASIARRRALAATYDEVLASIPGVTVPDHGARGEPAHYIYPVLLDPGYDRDAVRRAMMQNGIQTSMHYPPVHLFSHYGHARGTLPMTENVASRALTLPLYPQLTEAQVYEVAGALSRALGVRVAV